MSRPESVCVYCGTARPRTIALCGTCGRPWIDAVVSTTQPPPPDSGPEAGPPAAEPTRVLDAPPHAWGGDAEIDALTEEFLAQPHPDELSRRPVRPAVIGLGAVMVVLGIVGFVLRNPGTGTTGALDTTTTTAATTTTTTAPTTTTTTAPTTTEATTTTTTSTTTTTVPASTLPIDDLRLGVDAIGEIAFGTPGPDALESLSDLLGSPDGVGEATGELGLCPEETGTLATWGSLQVVFSTDPELEGDGFAGQGLAGYRLTDGSGHPTEALETVSGLRLGDRTSTMEIIYNRFIVEYPDDRTWTLTGGSGRLLLWGGVTEDRVISINSPNACDQSFG